MAESLRTDAVTRAAPLPTEQRERLAFVARGFETLLLRQLLQPLQQPLFTREDEHEDDPLVGVGAGGFEELGLLSLAEFLAHSGQGIGLARWLYRLWTGEELPLRSTGGPGRAPAPSVPSQSPEPPETKPGAPPATAAEHVRSALRPYWHWIEEAAAVTDLSLHLIAAVVWVESAGRPDAVSPAGAQGLMQLMPQTARELGVANPFDPRENLHAGSRYLHQMLRRFGTLPLALAAYNAGPGRVERYGDIPPFAQTRAYVRRVLELARRLEAEVTVAQAPL